MNKNKAFSLVEVIVSVFICCIFNFTLGIKTKIKINTETITSIKEKALFLFIIEIFLSN